MTFHGTETTSTALATTDEPTSSTPAQPQLAETAEQAYAAAMEKLESARKMSGVAAGRQERMVETQMLLAQAQYLETKRTNDLIAAQTEALTALTAAITAQNTAATDRSAT